jgi:hypothetical protein
MDSYVAFKLWAVREVSVPQLPSYGPERRDSRSTGPGEAEGGGLKLRETGPRSRTPGLPGPARPRGLGHGFPVSPQLYGAHRGESAANRLMELRLPAKEGVGHGIDDVPGI